MFNIQQCRNQYEMHEKLNCNSTSFEKITLTVTEYQKSRVDENEISFKGRMYDVKSALVSNGSVELLVINDPEEENILVKIKHFLNNPGTPGSKHPNQLHQLTSLSYLPSYTGILLFDQLPGTSIFHHAPLNFVSNKLEILSPPPKQA